MIGEDKLIHFSGVDMGEACTIVLRGASECLAAVHLASECQQECCAKVPCTQQGFAQSWCAGILTDVRNACELAFSSSTHKSVCTW